ncbi:MAG: fibronectin type III domain-containing protein [Gammaproteobacteria bacterium]|nr:MAG: fibronectin type III domain-containing protein [Gammaproteobacteria bacterium]
MTKAKRGLRTHRHASISLIALLGAALCACGGGGSGSATQTAPVSQSPGAGAPNTGNPSPPAPTSPAVTLAWEPPTQNGDGTPLTDLAGYKIHYGTESQNYTQTVPVANAGLASYVIDGLAAGTYYFAVTAYNSAGTDSPPSDEVSATVS